jgi:cellulose synthase/poly-beta-1,6-N-acetylglucosamine synthase-like glycosyltransferase
VGWAHDAIVYDEKPLTLWQSWNQRKRWMQGFTDVSSRYFFKLVKKAIRNCNFLLMDCALYSIQPIIAVLIGFSAISGGIQQIMKALDLISGFNTVVYSINFNLLTVAMILLSVLQFIYTPFILILEKKLNFKTFVYYIFYPVYAITWFPISLLGIIGKNNKEWNHTVHSRSVKIKDLEKAN